MSRFYSWELKATYLSHEVTTHKERMKELKAVSLDCHYTHFNIYIFK